MRFLKILFIFQLSILIPLSGNAQIAAPDFSCIKNDSLFWDFTNDFCGPFEQYVIYFSQNENGPYTILATVTDVNQTFFQHPNPAGNEYFYYITIERDCPGELK